jgi:hypothetical protein
VDRQQRLGAWPLWVREALIRSTNLCRWRKSHRRSVPYSISCCVSVKSTAPCPSSPSPNVHVIDVGRFLNGVLTGEWDITIGGRPFNRKWGRGGGFSLEGVHPGYTGQTLIANYILYEMNRILALGAPLYDLNPWVAADPYVDWDQDGWARGPSYEASGISSLLLMFRDPDDGNASIQVDLPPDVWTRISNTLLTEILEIPVMQAEASHLGIEAPRN